MKRTTRGREDKRQKRQVWKKVVENTAYSSFMTMVTLYALFGNDIKLSVTNSDADTIFVLLAWCCVVLFSIEMILSSLADDTYFGGFYFFIDLISTLSILTEIPIIVNTLLTGNQEEEDTAEMMRAGRVGTRASRVIRMVRLVRMVRIVKLYKLQKKKNKHDVLDQNASSSLEPTQVGKKLTEVTTRRLIIMMLTMIMVLPWLQTSSLVDNNYNFEHTFLKHLHLYPQSFNASHTINAHNFQRQVQKYEQGSHLPLLYLEICEPQSLGSQYQEEQEDQEDQEEDDDNDIFINTYFPDSYQCNTTWSHLILHDWIQTKSMLLPDKGLHENGLKGTRERALSVTKKAKHRINEFIISSHIGCYADNGLKLDGPVAGAKTDDNIKTPSCISLAIWSIRESERLSAVLTILKTFFIIIVLICASSMFHKDADLFVIGPIQRMMTLVKQLSENPLNSAVLKNNNSDQVRDQGYETILLEQTLERIGQLLQVGFGAAGAEIIGKNMNSDNGRLNPMIKGKKITGIYGFCDIRQFTDTTECLQEEVMVYVNKLGNLVHTAAHTFFGMANKNVGDAFLVSWKICDGLLDGFSNFTDEATEAQRIKANDTILCDTHIPELKISPSKMADSAITAFLKCIIALENENINGCLTCYALYNSVLKRFGQGFKIQMGFGMHIGWAIEGAIGSDLKIDATYLSPHVEMSDRLEASSKIFKAKLNMSHWLIHLATPNIHQYIRPIAKIRCPGLSLPFTIYTFDITHTVIPTTAISSDEKKTSQLQNAQHKKHILFSSSSSQLSSSHQHHHPSSTESSAPSHCVHNWDHSDFSFIQTNLHPQFLSTFKTAFDHFIQGDWFQAKKSLDLCNTLLINDGPTNYILNFILRHALSPPENWDGSHYLSCF